jgi:hypothetical protein
MEEQGHDAEEKIDPVLDMQGPPTQPPIFSKAEIDDVRITAMGYPYNVTPETKYSDKPPPSGLNDNPIDWKLSPITEAQRRRFHAIAKRAGRTDDQIAAFLLERIGSKNSRDIHRGVYENLCTDIVVPF